MPLAAFPKCYLEALCTSRTMSVEAWIDRSAAFDIDGLEFYWGFTPWHDERALERIRRRVEDQGRTIPMMCFSPDFTRPDARDRHQEVEQQRRAIRATAQLGGHYCRVLSGQRRPDVSREEGLDWVTACIHEALPTAEAHGVTLILENHYKDGFWDYPEFAQKEEVFLELLDRIGDVPSFGVNYDPSNALIAGDDPIALLEAVKHRVVTMHASDRSFQGGTSDDLQRLDADPHTGYASILHHGIIGQGLIDYDRIFAILRGVGFQGWVSIEDGQDPAVGDAHIAASATFLRAKMQAYGLP